jgi:hypothetical protein
MGLAARTPAAKIPTLDRKQCSIFTLPVTHRRVVRGIPDYDAWPMPTR